MLAVGWPPISLEAMASEHSTGDTANQAFHSRFTLQLFVASPLVVMLVLAATQAALLHSAEAVLNRAAAAGVQEASLPRASAASVALAVDRSLCGHPLARFVDRPIITVSGQPELLCPLGDALRGDEIRVSLGLWSTDAVPDFFGWAHWSLQGRKLRVDRAARKA
jgi:hypothetical protein